MLRKRKKKICKEEDDETSKVVNDIGTSVLKKTAANAAVATPSATPTGSGEGSGLKNDFSDDEIDDDPMISVILKQMEKRGNKGNQTVDDQFSQSAEEIIQQINDFLAQNRPQ